MQNDIIKAALKNNRTVMILGKAGTAKTATVNMIAGELGLPVEALPLAGISPEDIGGMPRPNNPDNPTAFRYLAPEWFMRHEGKPFVLFLDEFNQATIDTMHAMFYLVNDRMTAGRKNPEMRVIAAGNTEDENEFLTPIPAPLKDRFTYQVKWKCDIEASLSYLAKKFPDEDSARLIEAVRNSKHDNVTPRHVEQAIFMAQDGIIDIDRGRELIGSAYDVYLKGEKVKKRKDEDARLKYLAGLKADLKNEFVVKNGILVKVDKESLLSPLTPEEREIVLAA